MRCGTQDGLTTDQSGPDPAPANLSARQAKRREWLTTGTYGPPGSGSSPSHDLQSSLESRLRARLQGLGSTLYRQTWKEWVMPSGRVLFRLVASAVRTSDSGCSSWRTPSTSDDKRGTRDMADPKYSEMKRLQMSLTDQVSLAPWPTPRTPTGGPESAQRKKELGRENSGGGDLQAVALSAWTTPQAHDTSPRGKGQKAKHGTKHGCADLNADAELAAWPTPNTPSGGRSMSIEKMDATGKTVDGKKHTASLEHAVKFAAPWPTPMAGTPAQKGYNEAGNTDYSRRVVDLVQLTVFGETPNGSPAETEKPGQLNPALSRWLIGLPKEWDACGVMAMASLRQSRRSS